MIIVNPNKYVIFAELNEANHNKDYSVVKTFKVGLVASPFFVAVAFDKSLITPY